MIELLIDIVEMACYTLLGGLGVWIGGYKFVNAIILVLFFFLGTPFYARMLVHPDAGPVGWRKGLIYSIIFGAINILFELSITFVSLFIFSIIVQHGVYIK